MSKFLNSLFGRVVVALILGIALGAFFPHFAESLRPLGDGFLKLIKMVIGPIVFCVVVSGMANAGDLKKVGRVGLKAVIYFEIMTTLALGIGLVLAWLTRPGVGMNIDLRSLDASSLASYAKNAESLKDTAGYLMKIIPETAIDAFAKGDILQILVFAVLFGSALSLLGDKAQRVNSLIEELSHVFFRIIGFIIKLAPLGVLGAIAFTTGKYGVASLKQLGYLVAVFYLSCFVFVTVVLGAVMRLAGFSVFKLIRYLREELSIVLGTASSDAVLPQVMRKLEYMGVKDSTVGLVIPTGYSFNLDGFSIYLTLAVLFIAQATNTPLSTHDLIVVLLVSLVTSKGAHGIPETGDRDPRGDAVGDPRDSGTRPRADPAGRLVRRHRPRADQPDRQLRRDGGRRGVGERHRSCPRDPRAESRAALRAGRRGRPRGAVAGDKAHAL